MNNRPRTQVVSFDLDTTLCNTRHRWHMIDRKRGTDWEAYSMACVNDKPGPALVLAQLFTRLEIPFIVVSGRSECARECTRQWLSDHNVNPWAIYLCDERHNYMDHGAWKALRIQEIEEANNWEVVLHIDDFTAVAQALEKIEIPTMLVHDVDTEIPVHLG